MQGRRGNTILANGTPNAVAHVPTGLVRLRLVNGANARIFELSFSDNRVFHWIASEGGLLEKPIEMRSLSLSSGQRAEILVDFSDGRSVALEAPPDTNMPMMMMSNAPAGNPQTVLGFVPTPGGGRKWLSPTWR